MGGLIAEVKPNVESTGVVTGATETHAHRVAIRGLPIQELTLRAKVTETRTPTDPKKDYLKKDKDSAHRKDVNLLRGGMPKTTSL